MKDPAELCNGHFVESQESAVLNTQSKPQLICTLDIHSICAKAKRKPFNTTVFSSNEWHSDSRSMDTTFSDTGQDKNLFEVGSKKATVISMNVDNEREGRYVHGKSAWTRRSIVTTGVLPFTFCARVGNEWFSFVSIVYFVRCVFGFCLEGEKEVPKRCLDLSPFLLLEQGVCPWLQREGFTPPGIFKGTT